LFENGPKASLERLRGIIAGVEWEMDSGPRDGVKESDRKRMAVARIVQTPDSQLPYKVVLAGENGETTEHAFSTIRECEDFIKLNTPLPAKRSKLYDHKAGEA
jgi:hypothetical protein